MSEQYLSSVRLKPDASTRAMARVLDPKDPDQKLDTHHQLVWSMFAKQEATEQQVRPFLWRYDDNQFLILSESPPSDHHSLFDISTKTFSPALSVDDNLRFRLRANATVCRTVNDGQKRRQSRHDVVLDEIRNMENKEPMKSRAELREEATRIAAERWLANLGIKTGFAIESLDSVTHSVRALRRRKGANARLGILDLEGKLRVIDPSTFTVALTNGFGRAKAFGCGLMLIMRA